MSEDLFYLRPIAKIYTDFHERFGIPRQAGLSDGLVGRIVFEPEFRNINAVKGIDAFTHLWLIWSFSETQIDMNKSPAKWAPMVTPPRLGGKIKEGVFATRSPYRPNSLALSSVKLLNVDLKSVDAPIIFVEGADILDGTSIFDIKPYLPYTDSHPDASNGWAVSEIQSLNVDFPDALKAKVDPNKLPSLLSILAQDPRGSYEKQSGYIYGLHFAEYDVRFTVDGDILHVLQIVIVDERFKKIK